MSVAYFLCFGLGLAGALLQVRYGHALGVLDRPNQRSSHAIPTPKGGGIGIVAAFIIAAFFVRPPLVLIGPAALIAAFSFIADRYDISARVRLAVHFLAALMAVVGLWAGNFSALQALLLVPTLIFVVGTANFYNFMDGINGIAAMTGIIGFSLIAYYAFAIAGQLGIGVMSLCIACACAGFLPFNFPVARVFMGDIGSVFLGFVFAALVVLLSKTFFDFLCLASFIFPFYVDELTTMCVRIARRDNLTRPHRKHLYQLLANELKKPHWKVTALYAALQLVIGVSSLCLRSFGVIMVVALCGYFVVFAFFSYQVRKRLAGIQIP